MKNKIILILSIIVVIQALLLVKSARKETAKTTLPKKQAETTAAIIDKRDPERAKVAIILDDWGYNLNNLAALKNIELPITLAVLPNLAYSQKVAKEAHRMGKQVILHLPLEPYESDVKPLETDTIMTNMTKEEIIVIIDKNFENLSVAKGASNHQGSKATADKRVIKIIFEEFKKHDFFFIDSLTGKTVCKKIARKLGVKFAERNIFLDNQRDEEYIEEQMRKLIKQAKSKGKAIGIGHDRSLTLEVLRRLMPELERTEGVTFVFASELTE